MEANERDRHIEYILQCVEVSRRARESGNTPFGCLLVDGEGKVLLEQGNIEITERSCTGHAETTLMAAAFKRFSKEKLWTCTLYSTAEPCAMCAGGLRHFRKKAWGAYRRRRTELDARSSLPDGFLQRAQARRGDRPVPRGRSRRCRRSRGVLVVTARLSDINAMNRKDFTDLLGSVFEHSPWVAESAWSLLPFASVAELHAGMMSIVHGAPADRMTELIRAHPDLATRLGIGSLTSYSAKEQQGAGLDSLTPNEFATFTSLNVVYKQQFGFPFIYAVRGRSKDDILASMRARIGHDQEEERREAIEQIGRIAGFRLADLIEE
jgi:2-oxo-4-hydroxy-4-carboxy-5-ureidoimidazoline decarboxylase